MYHYGWVKDPRAMQLKQESFHKLWHEDAWLDQHVVPAHEFDYSVIDALEPFTGSHPKVMMERIQKRNWIFDHDISSNKTPFKDKIKKALKKNLGIHVGYKNYRIV